MAVSNVNVVVITGNLTRDPEVRSIPGGSSVCKLRVAVNSRRKDGQTGEWVDRPNFFDVDVYGSRGEFAAKHLSKGCPVAVEGSLVYRDWETKDGGKRSAVSIKADQVQFLAAPAARGTGAEEVESEESDSTEVQVTGQARSKAEELGVDIAEVQPKDGQKVRASDVEAYAAAA